MNNPSTISWIPTTGWILTTGSVLTTLVCLGLVLGCNSETEKAAASPTTQKPSPLSKDNGAGSNAPETQRKIPQAAPAEVDALCEKSCKTTEPLGCLSATLCKRQCLENFVLPVCQQEFLAVLKCAADQPAEGWACAPHSAPAMKEPVCAGEQEAAMTCVASKIPLR
jgi:hypothetical protein